VTTRTHEVVDSPVVDTPVEGGFAALRELCHDLRQPAATIGALVEAARLEPGLSAGVLRRLDQIRTESEQLSELIRHVLDGALSFELLEAGRVAQDVIEGIRLTYHGGLQVVAEADVAVLADRVALRRALVNLVDNATRAAGPDGNVALTVGRRNGWVHFDVNDSGKCAGLSHGPGLGLRIVERVTSTHGGDLAFLPSHLGGTLARLRLPVVRSHIERAAGRSGA
jgi:signal transduction histidine kinase